MRDMANFHPDDENQSQFKRVSLIGQIFYLKITETDSNIAILGLWILYQSMDEITNPR